MAIRILTEEDKLELEGKIARGSAAADAVIGLPSLTPGQLWSAERFTVLSGSLDAVWQKGLEGQQPVVQLRYSGESEGDEIRKYYAVTGIRTYDVNANYSFVEVEFSVRDGDLVWKCTLTSQGEANIRDNVITGCSYLDDREDLYGYATEEWVQQGYQPKGDYMASSDLPAAVSDALAQAKDSGEFDGEDGYTPVKGIDYFDGKDGETPVRGKDYWTASDISEIKSYVDDAILGGAW